MKALTEAGSAGQYWEKIERRTWEKSKMTVLNSASSDKATRSLKEELSWGKYPVLISLEINRTVASMQAAIPCRDSIKKPKEGDGFSDSVKQIPGILIITPVLPRPYDMDTD